MDLKSLFSIAFQVLKDWRVIAITAAVILYLTFFINAATYKKKKLKKTKQKRPAPKAAPPKKEAPDADADDSSDEETAE
jgi:hypothetical protein